MNISAQFRQKLAALGTGGETTLTVSDGPRQLTCHVSERSSLAVALRELTLQTSELASSSVTDLQRLCEALASRLTYLLEPVAPIEADAEQCVVQMRSNPPHKDENGRTYYELLVRRGGELRLARYRKEAGSARTPIPANVTLEVLQRLVDDFCAVLDG